MTTDELIARLAALFTGLSRAYGTYQIHPSTNGSKKVAGKALTVHGPVTLRLWREHLAGVQGLGIIPMTDEGVSWFGGIDIDQYPIDIEAVEKKAHELNLPLVLTRSKSGGVHCWLFLRVPVLTALIKMYLEEWSIAMGFAGAEVFPKQEKLVGKEDVGNWINMPYFDEEHGTKRFGVYQGKELTLEEFVARVERLRVTPEQLEAVHATLSGKDFEGGPPCLQALASTGFHPGTRNNGMYAVAVFLKKCYPDDWRSKLHVYNEKYFKPPVDDSEIKSIIKSLGNKAYNYKCKESPCRDVCNPGVCRTRPFGVGMEQPEIFALTFDNTGALKHMTKPPYWMVTINGRRVKLTSEEIHSQTAFAKLCIEALNTSPPPIAGPRWRKLMTDMMGSAQEMEEAPEFSDSGDVKHWLEYFTTVHPQAETPEEIYTGKPFHKDGWAYFRLIDFKALLSAKKVPNITNSELSAQLKEWGMESKQLWFQDSNMRLCAVPVTEGKPVEIPTKRVS